ncbi:hypothetical protein Ga0102493_11667 [Erythrobacter litoralis]|uniref:Argininosuccinate lyase n=1 Tax=Erythrobacter litoralis TaxID=39960 RepID=A0A074MY51_9SPHN|nr:hypothetical protein [Erythrobacter litoralis]AOL24797.1 hypothetical protein Ga0102493_11667 [Erythrobacter litoralis]KEO96773.1 hypothetical protein EH32_08815 [Erythrobacter litoralis]MEE4339810.1 hypothetical protein [Erythrobacter sp.]
MTYNARPALTLVPALALALAACAGEEEERNYEVDAEDLSGGELQVREPDPNEVPVDVPEVEMTNVPPEEAEAMEQGAMEQGASYE